jgi:peptidoglycan hydrolase CwlO-like protein
MTKKSLIFWLFLLLLAPCFLFGSKISAQTADSYAQQLSDVDAQRAALQKQLNDIETQITQYQKDLTKIGAQKNTLANKIKQLKLKQAQLALQIKDMTLRLDDLQIQILQNQADTQTNADQLSALKDEVAEIVRQIWKLDRYSSLDILISSENISNFYDRLHSFEMVGEGLGQLLQSLKVAERNLADTEQELAAKQAEEQNYVQIISLQKDQLTTNLKDQNTLLAQTKGKEANYQDMLKQSKAQANEIRNRIYSLIQTSQQITFGQAVSIATWAGGQTGVRPAMLLAILTQESNLGKNVGTCNRKGDPPSKSWKVVMKPERDQQPFLQITKALGRDPDVTPVSCPMHDKSGAQIGWGGAMGPAQFIPSTWIGYQSKITAITGTPADPWDIRDAFLAAALKLAADGGTSKSGEWAAAMKYFSGGTNTAYRFYGDNVVATADKYQKDIDQMNN